MTDADYRDALELLDDAATLLQRLHATPQAQLVRELRRLSLELDLLKVRLGQSDALLQRN